MRGRTPRVHDALGNALVVEVRNLFPQDEIFQQRRPAQPSLERVLVIADGYALVGGQPLVAGVRPHARQAAVYGVDAGRRRINGFAGRLAFRQGTGAHGSVSSRHVRTGVGATRGLVAVFGGLVGVVRDGACGGAHGGRAFQRGVAGLASRAGSGAAVAIHIGGIQRASCAFACRAFVLGFLACHGDLLVVQHFFARLLGSRCTDGALHLLHLFGRWQHGGQAQRLNP